MLVTRKLCMTKDVGCNGNLFGGNMLSAIDEAAAIFAHLYTGEKSMVTVKFSELVFKKPVKVGEIIEFECELIEMGRTSIKFKIEAKRRWGCAKMTTDSEVVCSTECVFVAIDENGHSKEIGK